MVHFASSSSAASAFIFAAFLPTALAHAGITSPPIRSPGQNFLSACGQTSFDSVKGDPTGHIEEQTPVTAGCELTLCRGMLFSDQPASNVQKVTPGQNMAMAVDCTIPHGGPANVSLVDTTAGGSGEVIGSFLKTFDDFCPTSGGTPADQSNLQFTLPNADAVGSKCQTAGDCVVQLFWATPDFSQNYYYCVDVAMAADNSTSSAAASGSASASASSSTSAASSKSAASTSAAASSASVSAASTSSVSSVASSSVASSSAASASASASDAASTATTEVATFVSSVSAVLSTATSTPTSTATRMTTSTVTAGASGTAAEANGAVSTTGALTSGARRRVRLFWF
ncbi:uncharacterized protein STEHIDRAFT_122996 [Stereum hirsutum FP-91666 SS1]|uniref:uncharacterized protein n=1 Tax=Stereum hirsutum (strain FP-91666) TaxID=721885 RepID=UPI000444A868|nr:uncharacterized protein STEHIDRAFT_122996 [Stereum hirsutum FP-91666 SS1]EIM85095.1 hypothetical protein STEHIDRAFT_122996 [Stereum hirsutum FP-91666 SS1]